MFLAVVVGGSGKVQCLFLQSVVLFQQILNQLGIPFDLLVVLKLSLGKQLRKHATRHDARGNLQELGEYEYRMLYRAPTVYFMLFYIPTPST